MHPVPSMTRRQFLASAALASGAVALAAPEKAPEPLALGKAEHCVFIWLGGGMSQIDTFDAKKKRGDGKKDAGCYYDTIETAIPGVTFCEHLPRLAKMADRLIPVR